MYPYPDIPEPGSRPGRIVLHYLHVLLHLKRCQNHLDRICPVSLRDASGTHVGVTNRFDFFYPVFLRHRIEMKEEAIELIYQGLRVHLFSNLRKSLDI